MYKNFKSDCYNKKKHLQIKNIKHIKYNGNLLPYDKVQQNKTYLTETTKKSHIEYLNNRKVISHKLNELTNLNYNNNKDFVDNFTINNKKLNTKLKFYDYH